MIILNGGRRVLRLSPFSSYAFIILRLHAADKGTSAFPAKSDQTDQKKKKSQNHPRTGKDGGRGRVRIREIERPKIHRFSGGVLIRLGNAETHPFGE